MPNLLPGSVFDFQLDWMGPAGRLVWSVLLTTIGLFWVMLLMKRQAVTSKVAGPGILIVGTGAGIAMVLAGKTFLDGTLTGDTLVPFGFMIAWFSFVCGIWTLIMSVTFNPLELKFSHKQQLWGTIAIVIGLYVLGGLIGSSQLWFVFVTTWLIFTVIVVSISLYIWSLPRRENDATWAEAIAGALAVFVMMTFIYALIPHEWITFATSYLNFTKDVKVSEGGTFVLQTWLNGDVWTKQTRVIPFEINLEIIQDHATIAIYVITATINIKLFAAWQKRNVPVVAPEESETNEAPSKTSRFGRPLRALKPSRA
jgi:hypothetical protein